ncbi:MAG TPA: 4-alpha-glucanotransferase [Spirochaetales bacterium]|nr:4-alpha-glucanotransferase [Spirochaetales bacterium]
MTNTEQRRFCGVLMHPTSLEGRHGIGDLGPKAYAFVDSLKKADVRMWQILPLGPTGYGNSPYASRSTFAGNELLLSLSLLAKEGYLSNEQVDSPPPFPKDRVDYSLVEAWKMPLLKIAAGNFLDQGDQKDEFSDFCDRNQFWLDDYALFMILYEHYNDARWFSVWKKEDGVYSKDTVARLQKKHPRKIAIWKALQFFFELQWQDLKRYANGHEVSIVGDIPIFVAADSVDTWSNISLFKTDESFHYSGVSGVPPDFFCATGQLWGNPLYDWEVMKQDNYQWWMQRMKAQLHQCDILRIDHFRGFESYWEVPYGHKTAEHGSWVKAPGSDFFKQVKKQLGELPIFAEDLGFMTPEVERLRDENNFPGMRICQFGFTRDVADFPNPYDLFLPHNYPSNCVAYTGTHDNNTVRGWFEELENKDKEMVMTYLGCHQKEVVWAMIRCIMASHAQHVIFPMQDLLDLDAKARMNTPSTCGSHNWSWRMEQEHECDASLAKLEKLITIYGRNGKLADEKELGHLLAQTGRPC